jgi:hypothetical protein
MPRLTNLILLVMKSLPRINETYLNYIKENEQLYATTPIEVKRQIWCLNPGRFKQYSIFFLNLFLLLLLLSKNRCVL